MNVVQGEVLTFHDLTLEIRHCHLCQQKSLKFARFKAGEFYSTSWWKKGKEGSRRACDTGDTVIFKKYNLPQCISFTKYSVDISDSIPVIKATYNLFIYLSLSFIIFLLSQETTSQAKIFFFKLVFQIFHFSIFLFSYKWNMFTLTHWNEELGF